jgi:hypothetical protein
VVGFFPRLDLLRALVSGEKGAGGIKLARLLYRGGWLTASLPNPDNAFGVPSPIDSAIAVQRGDGAMGIGAGAGKSTLANSWITLP